MTFSMWLFKKKVTCEELKRFKTTVKSSFSKHKKEITQLHNKCKFLQKELNTLKPLSKRFSELQNQFTELISQFSNGSLNPTSTEKANAKSESKVKPAILKDSDSASKPLTQLERKAFIFIGRLQNESGGNWISIGSLTANLYPDQLNLKIKTTVSNVLKRLVDSGLIIRERKGNHWFIRLSNKGFEALRKELNENQLKGLIEVYKSN